MSYPIAHYYNIVFFLLKCQSRSTLATACNGRSGRSRSIDRGTGDIWCDRSEHDISIEKQTFDISQRHVSSVALPTDRQIQEMRYDEEVERTVSENGQKIHGENRLQDQTAARCCRPVERSSPGRQ